MPRLPDPVNCQVLAGQASDGVTWLDDLAAWDCRLPAVLVLHDAARAERHRLLSRMTELATGRAPNTATLLHRPGRRPRLVGEDGSLSTIGLSLSSRGPFAALAIADGSVGVDVELVEGTGELPWACLSEGERAALDSLAGSERGAVFARIWSLKEAYLKALGVGLSRDPAEIDVRTIDAARARITDAARTGEAAQGITVWRDRGFDRAAVSIVRLGPSV